MIPVPGFDSVRFAWIEIRQEGFSLHGFLLFRFSDHFFPEYLDGDGLDDLNVWTGDDCAVFVVQSPSAKWIDYTRTTNHTWWKLFGRYTSNAPSASLATPVSSPDSGAVESDLRFSDLARELGNTAVLSIDDDDLTLRDIFAPCLNQFQHSQEIAKILHRFGLGPTEHPCLILFRDIKDRHIWSVDLRDLRGLSEPDLGRALQRWFGGPEFERLMEDARHA